MAQPISAATSNGTSFGMAVTRFSDTTARSWNVVTQPAFTVRSSHAYVAGRAWMPAPFRQCMTT